MRTLLMQPDISAALRTMPAAAARIEAAGQRVLQRELRRPRLLNALPADTQDKLRNDRSLCFSPWCSREFHGGRRVQRRFVQRQPTDHQRECKDGARV